MSRENEGFEMTGVHGVIEESMGRLSLPLKWCCTNSEALR